MGRVGKHVLEYLKRELALNKMKVLCIYHKADLDGVCSAAIVHKEYPNCELYGMDYGDGFNWDRLIGVDRVIMVDFSLPLHSMKRLENSIDFIWIDHHRSAIVKFDSYGFWRGRACKSSWVCMFRCEY